MIPAYGADGRSGVFPGSTVFEPVGIAWSVETAAPVVASPVLAGERLVFADAGATVYAVDATTGAPCWRYTHRAIDAELEAGHDDVGFDRDGDWPVGMDEDEPGITTAPCVYGDWVFVEESRSSGWVYVHDLHSGAVLHTIRQGGCPTVFGDILLLQDINAGVRAIRLPGLTPLWRRDEDDDFEGWLRASPALGAHGVAYAARGSESHHTHPGVTAFDVSSGEPLFCREDDDAAFGEDLSHGGQSRCFQVVHAVAADGLVWLPVVREHENGRRNAEILGLDARSGVERWAYRLAAEPDSWIEVAVAVSADTVYFIVCLAGASDQLCAVDLRSRNLRWSAVVTAGRAGSPVLAGGMVYTAASGGTVQVFDAATGEPRGTIETGRDILNSYDHLDNAEDGAYYEEDELAVLPGDGIVYVRTGMGITALR